MSRYQSVATTLACLSARFGQWPPTFAGPDDPPRRVSPWISSRRAGSPGDCARPAAHPVPHRRRPLGAARHRARLRPRLHRRHRRQHRAARASASDLDADAAGLQWTVNGYTLSLAALILLGGSLGDRYGRRRVFVIGVVWFAAASLLCGLAPNVETLIAARVLQGVGGALLTPGALAILEASFAREDRARAIGAWSGLGGIAGALGPFLGGWLVQVATWRLHLPDQRAAGRWSSPWSRRGTCRSRATPRRPAALDVAGVLTGAAGPGRPDLRLHRLAGARARRRPAVLVALAIGVAGLVAFVLAERRSRAPDAAAGDLRSAGRSPRPTW